MADVHALQHGPVRQGLTDRHRNLGPILEPDDGRAPAQTIGTDAEQAIAAAVGLYRGSARASRRKGVQAA